MVVVGPVEGRVRPPFTSRLEDEGIEVEPEELEGLEGRTVVVPGSDLDGLEELLPGRAAGGELGRTEGDEGRTLPPPE